MDPSSVATTLLPLGGGGVLLGVIGVQFRMILTLTERLNERADRGEARADAENERLRAELAELRRRTGRAP